MWFPGEVLSIKSVEAASEDNPWDHTYIITANFMHPTSEGGSSFKWPGKNDISDIDSKFIFYKNIDIIQGSKNFLEPCCPVGQPAF